jgi:hypothetical protein
MDYEFQARLKSALGLRFVFEPAVYGLHGPLAGDRTNREYRRPLPAWPEGPRRGLSAYAGEDPSRFELRSAMAAATPDASDAPGGPHAPRASQYGDLGRARP